MDMVYTDEAICPTLNFVVIQIKMDMVYTSNGTNSRRLPL